ncbi:MAG: LptF/LptG family permease [Desulfovibrio sp.]
MKIPGISLLATYLIRQNLFFMVICLFAGTGIYLLADIFDRLDQFLDAGFTTWEVLRYFGVKVPMIFSQILPAVFLLGLVIQLGILTRNQEMLAVRAGGVSFGWFIRFFLVYSLIWGGIEFAFSQYVGVYGEIEAARIWKEDLRKQKLDREVVNNVWFKSGNYIVYCDTALPYQKRAEGVSVYQFAENSQSLAEIAAAKSAKALEGEWILEDVNILATEAFMGWKEEKMSFPIEQDLKVFALSHRPDSQARLPLNELGDLISRLKNTGSNTEFLETAWHGKWAYAFSMVPMGLCALVIVTICQNLYINVGIGLLFVFAYYGAFLVGMSAGESGSMPPAIGAWFGNIVLTTLALFRLTYYNSPRLQRLFIKWFDLFK